MNRIRLLSTAALTTLLVGCVSVPTPDVRRESIPVPIVQGQQDILDATHEAQDPEARIRHGTGQLIDTAAASAPRPVADATTGSARFNFEGESLHGVVKVILGDMLGQNYVIAPGVSGTVTLATPKPVSPASALSLLQMVLGWNNARMVYSGGRYNIVPAEQALPGNIAPGVGPATTAGGFEARVVPLQYISASEMKKLLEPYARPDAIVGIDSFRNTITVAGSGSELENYLRTIDIFDVDWLSGMSVGVFPLESGRADRVVADLERVFGEQGGSPVAGMFRFMPLEAANAILVITPQPAYLDDIRQWLERIGSAGDEMRLYSHALRYIQASELAERLSEVFGGSRVERRDDSRPATLMPGLDSVQLQSHPGGSTAMIGPGRGAGAIPRSDADQGSGTSVRLEVEGSEVGVSSVEETNSLLVRATPRAWRSIREVIEKLDVMPTQIHIEAQVASVTLTGELQYGVNWYFERAVTDAGLPSAMGRDTWSTLAGSVARAGGNPGGIGPGLAWTFLGRNAAAVISALDEVTDVNLLQTPSVLVRNNAEATFNVGSRIPISSVVVNPGTGGDTTYSQVQYLDTGVILRVRPRASQDGMVFLDIMQEISSPGSQPDAQGNVRIDTQKLDTRAAIRSGQTVMLAGLISDGVTSGSSGFPGLSRIPLIGALFGERTSTNSRTETIVLLTPTIVRSPQEARDLTDEYGRRFQVMKPLHGQSVE